jgi:hypothetical protein
MKNRLTLLIVAGAVLAIAAGVSYAAIPSSSGTISACKDNKGALKVIDAEAGQTCSANQQLLTWNQQGPPGQSGVSGYEVVEADSVSNDSTAEKVAGATCPNGKVPVGGGAKILRTDTGAWGGVALVKSGPTATGWIADAREIVPTDVGWYVLVQVICVTAL